MTLQEKIQKKSEEYKENQRFIKTLIMPQIEGYLKVIADPKGMSRENGTPKTNMEAYLDKYDEERARSKNWH